MYRASISDTNFIYMSYFAVWKRVQQKNYELLAMLITNIITFFYYQELFCPEHISVTIGDIDFIFVVYI